MEAIRRQFAHQAVKPAQRPPYLPGLLGISEAIQASGIVDVADGSPVVAALIPMNILARPGRNDFRQAPG